MDARHGTRTLCTALAVTALLATGTGAAAAADASPAPGPTGDGAHALCKRVPKLDRRIARSLKRLDAGAGARGSVSRLQKRVDNAKKAGDSAVATYLQDRLNHRKQLRTDLGTRQKDLAAVRSWCAAHGNGAKAS
ncbi:hypothetical protein ACLMNJ_21210 [Streptomyces seoulensis]